VGSDAASSDSSDEEDADEEDADEEDAYAWLTRAGAGNMEVDEVAAPAPPQPLPPPRVPSDLNALYGAVRERPPLTGIDPVTGRQLLHACRPARVDFLRRTWWERDTVLAPVPFEVLRGGRFHNPNRAALVIDALQGAADRAARPGRHPVGPGGFDHLDRILPLSKADADGMRVIHSLAPAFKDLPSSPIARLPVSVVAEKTVALCEVAGMVSWAATALIDPKADPSTLALVTYADFFDKLSRQPFIDQPLDSLDGEQEGRVRVACEGAATALRAARAERRAYNAGVLVRVDALVSRAGADPVSDLLAEDGWARTNPNAAYVLTVPAAASAFTYLEGRMCTNGEIRAGIISHGLIHPSRVGVIVDLLLNESFTLSHGLHWLFRIQVNTTDSISNQTRWGSGLHGGADKAAIYVEGVGAKPTDGNRISAVLYSLWDFYRTGERGRGGLRPRIVVGLVELLRRVNLIFPPMHPTRAMTMNTLVEIIREQASENAGGAVRWRRRRGHLVRGAWCNMYTQRDPDNNQAVHVGVYMDPLPPGLAGTAAAARAAFVARGGGVGDVGGAAVLGGPAEEGRGRGRAPAVPDMPIFVAPNMRIADNVEDTRVEMARQRRGVAAAAAEPYVAETRAQVAAFAAAVNAAFPVPGAAAEAAAEDACR
jgi:hypothetical protein